MTIAISQSSLRRIPYLDGWRGIAILLVLQAHFVQIRGFDSGRMGVDVFFVLSGLLMTRILFVKRMPLDTFYVRRLSRILPVFLLYVISIYLVGYLFLQSHESSNFFSTLFFLRTYFPGNPGIWNTDLPIGHIWSLNVEEHCYLFLGMMTLVSAVRRREHLVMAAIAGACFVAVLVYSQIPQIAPANFELHTEVAAVFVLLSGAYSLVKVRVSARVRSWQPLVAFALATLCYLSYAPWYCKLFFAPFLLAFAVNHLDRLDEKFLAALSWKPMRLLGIWSYSIYLWQQPFHDWVVKSGSLPLYEKALIGAFVVALGAVSFYMFENPLRKAINGRWQKKRAGNERTVPRAGHGDAPETFDRAI